MFLECNNVHRLNYLDKEIILIATAHVSKNSAEEVRQVIEREKPDSVCIELDEGRYKSLKEKDKWKNTDIVKIIKEKKVGFMFTNILLSNYQRKIAEQFNISAGQEMIQGIESSEEIGSNLVLADRDIQITFSRVWRGVSFWGKIKLMGSILFSLIDDEDISEEDLEKMKQEDMLNSALSELSDSFPGLKTYLVDERDQYLANKIKNSPGSKIIAVLGAAHVPGIKKEIFIEQNMEEISTLPPKSLLSKSIGWLIPVIIIILLLVSFSMDKLTGVTYLKSWLFWNGGLAALGTILAMGHPLSILTSLLLAPISSLNPLIAVGWFSGLVEAHFRKPKVEDFEKLSKDLYSFKGLWKNKVTRVLLVVVLANLGSVIGTAISTVDIFSSFIQMIFG
ncbi:TraB family protein [Alkalibaculum sp. M08DMB]|uniref:TraB family protein n=1 Tax=Alkalibaculum sporogenes TaxID=2655001 RepID=A0A6A7KCL2_9FIRM|nr:TraB/GumN family protein [Alkalibaculum sporogenes]MPW27270.1 TraB family protein [Alkalibaculum sporogenes]